MCCYNDVRKYLNDFFLLKNLTIYTTAMITMITMITTSPIIGTIATTNQLVLSDCRLIVGLIGIVLVVITTVLQNIKQDMQITTLPDTEVIVSL